MGVMVKQPAHHQVWQDKDCSEVADRKHLGTLQDAARRCVMQERGSNSAQPTLEGITTHTPATHYLPKTHHTTISTTAPCDSRWGLCEGGQRKRHKRRAFPPLSLTFPPHRKDHQATVLPTLARFLWHSRDLKC